MSASKKGIRIAVVIGTSRPGNYTSKAVRLVIDELERSGVTVGVFDPAASPLAPPGVDIEGAAPNDLREMIHNASGIILSTPEYHGSISSTIKLIIENLGYPSVMAGRPVALLGVAAGRIGAIKSLEQLRSVCSHVGAIVLPGPVSVANVRQVFTPQGECLDDGVEKQVRGVATNLLDYLRTSVCPRIALEQMVRAKSA